MCRSAARTQRNVPLSVTSSTFAHCSSVMSTRFAVPPSPALFTTTSISPTAAAAPANSACTCSSTVTSHGNAAATASPSCSAASPSRRSCASLITTRAPSAMQRSAVANPMPVPAAAVTSTCLPGEQPVARRAAAGDTGDVVVGSRQTTFGSGGRPRTRSPMMLR